MSKPQALFASAPIQLYQNQQFYATAGVAVTRKGEDNAAVQCYSQKQEVYAAIAVSPEWQLYPSESADGAYVSFADANATNWSIRFRTPATQLEFLLHVTLCKIASGKKFPTPHTAVLNPNVTAEEVAGAGHTVTATVYQWPITITGSIYKLGDAQPPTEKKLTAGEEGGLQQCVSGYGKGQKLLHVSSDATTCYVVDLRSIGKAGSPKTVTFGSSTTNEDVPSDIPVRPPPAIKQPQQQQQAAHSVVVQPQPASTGTTTTTAPTTTQAPATGYAAPQQATSTSDAVMQALILSNLQQTPVHFAAVHKKLDQMVDKLENFDLSSQYAGFQKIIQEFDRSNRDFHESQNRKEKALMEAESNLVRERGEHSVTRQELLISQRELRATTEVKVSYQNKTAKWKKKHKSLDEQRLEDKEEAQRLFDEQIAEWKERVAANKARIKELEEEMKAVEQDAREAGIQEGKAIAVSRTTADHTTHIPDGSAFESVVLLKQKMERAEDEMKLERKSHNEEIVKLQDQLLEAKEQCAGKERQVHVVKKEIGDLKATIEQKEVEIVEAKSEHDEDVTRLKQRLHTVGEGQLAMNLENMKHELALKEKEIDVLKEQLHEKNMGESAKTEAVEKSKGRISEELSLMKSEQARHDAESNSLREQMVDVRTENMRLQERVTNLQHELSLTKNKNLDLEDQVDRLEESIRLGSSDATPKPQGEENEAPSSLPLPPPPLPVPPPIPQEAKQEGSSEDTIKRDEGIEGEEKPDMASAIKEIMSEVYYDLEDQIDEEKEYKGEELLKMILELIKAKTVELLE